MQPLAALEVAGVLLVTAVVGVVAHELSHVLVLRLSGVTCTVAVLPNPDDRGGGFTSGLSRPLVRVTPTRLPADLSPWRLRTAALMPLALSVPLALVFLGVLPDPFAADGLAPRLAFLVWIGCSIPSPQDFSLAWYPEQAVASARDGAASPTAGSLWSGGT